MSNLAFATVHEVLISAHGRTSASDEQWAVYLAYVRDKKPTRVLVVSTGGALTANQRHSLTSATPSDAKVAVLTDSAFSRAMVAALASFHPSVYRSFALEQLEEALRFLAIPGAYVPQVRQQLAELQSAVQRPRAPRV